MTTIKLQKNRWKYDENLPIGDTGGCGQVFKGLSEDKQEIAVKKLNIDAVASAHRERDMVSYLIVKKSDHIIPFLDFGLDSESDQNGTKLRSFG